jgi:hypothetical protein
LNYNCRLLFPFHARIARFNLCRKRSDEPAVSGRSTSSTNYCRYRTSKASEGFADIRHCPLKSFVNSRNHRHGDGLHGEDRGVGVAEHMDACVYRKTQTRCAQASKPQLMEFVLINPPNKSTKNSVKLIHRYLRIAFTFRSPFFFASAAVFFNTAQQHNEKKC